MNARSLLGTKAPPATLLIRLMVGAVFLSEGIQKFLNPGSRGPGRFESMGFPNPEFWGTFVGVVEIVAGILILIGLGTRLAAAATAFIMTIAITTTKIPILIGHDLGRFQVRDLNTYGFWSMAHEMRTDWAMLLGSLFLVIVGAGAWSLDARISSRGVTARPAAHARGVREDG